jgi:hypothetical protein
MALPELHNIASLSHLGYISFSFSFDGLGILACF